MIHMNKMQKKLVGFCLAGIMLGSSLMTAGAASMDSLQQDLEQLQQAQQDLQEQMDNMQDEQTSLEGQLETTEQKAQELEKEKQQIEENIKQLDSQLGEAAQQLNEIAQQEKEKQQKIDDANVRLTSAQETEHKQYENMKLRIRYMYEQGSQNYIAVLLKAADASDLLNRAEYISSIYRYDRKMLEAYEEAKKQVETQKEILTNEYKQLEELQAQAEQKKASVEQLMAQKDQELQRSVANLSATRSLAQQYQEQIDYRENVISQLEAAAFDNAAQQNQTVAAINSLLSQANEANREQVEASAAQAVLQSMAELAQQKLEGYEPTVDPNSLFVWPCPSSTRITSDFGYRIHPIYGEY